MTRFYPDSFPPIPNEPSTNNFEICQISDSVGEGVVARAHFSTGEIVCAFSGYLVDTITQFSLTVGPNQHIHDPHFMGKILHSCDPNLHCDMTQRIFTAIRDIRPGDAITMDYDQTEERLFKPFHCSCGADNCRGLIAGNSVRPYKRQKDTRAANVAIGA